MRNGRKELGNAIVMGAVLLATAALGLASGKLADLAGFKAFRGAGSCASKYNGLCALLGPATPSRAGDPSRASRSPDTASPTERSQAAPQAGTRNDEAGAVRVGRENGKWTIRGAKTTVELDPADLRLTAHVAGQTWAFLPSSDGDLTVKIDASPDAASSTRNTSAGSTETAKADAQTPAAAPNPAAATHSLRLASAAVKTVEPYATGYMSGVKITLSGYRVPLGPAASGRRAAAAASEMGAPGTAEPDPLRASKALDLTVQIFLGLEGRDEDLVIRIIASDGTARAREILFPPSLDPASFDATVVPFMQGMLLPKSWPRKVFLYDEISYGRGLYMPWWGHQRGSGAAAAPGDKRTGTGRAATGAVLVLLETPADAGVRFSHPAGGPTRADVRWLHSLGRWSYPRRVRCAFLPGGNYVTLAKRYRRHVVETGHFVSLKEKIARNPLVARLIGSPVIHTSILYHIQPDSGYYKKDDPAANHQLVTFDRRAAELRALAASGVKKAYVHLDGWGVRGYDNLHPDYLPPSPEAGGWDGMKRFAEACDELGYVFAVHDQYRDYYMDAPSYDPRHTVMNEDGSRPDHATWYGGRQSILCSSLAPGFVRRNFHELLARGVKVRGAYLDVFSVVPGDECWNTEHPVTRGESLAYRAECLDFVRSFGGVVSSEEPCDWAIPHLDIVHHAPHALDPNPGQGEAMGIPVPLYSLVYHDALFVPWSLGKGAWGIPQADPGWLYGMGNGGLPYLSIEPTADELERGWVMCVLNEKVALLELVNHEFLDEGRGPAALQSSRGLWSPYGRQRFTYADGTRITVDFATGVYEIAYAQAGATDSPPTILSAGGRRR